MTDDPAGFEDASPVPAWTAETLGERVLASTPLVTYALCQPPAAGFRPCLPCCPPDPHPSERLSASSTILMALSAPSCISFRFSHPRANPGPAWPAGSAPATVRMGGIHLQRTSSSLWWKTNACTAVNGSSLKKKKKSTKSIGDPVAIGTGVTACFR